MWRLRRAVKVIPNPLSPQLRARRVFAEEALNKKAQGEEHPFDKLLRWTQDGVRTPPEVSVPEWLRPRWERISELFEAVRKAGG